MIGKVAGGLWLGLNLVVMMRRDFPPVFFTIKCLYQPVLPIVSLEGVAETLEQELVHLAEIQEEVA